MIFAQLLWEFWRQPISERLKIYKTLMDEYHWTPSQILNEITLDDWEIWQPKEVDVTELLENQEIDPNQGRVTGQEGLDLAKEMKDGIIAGELGQLESGRLPGNGGRPDENRNGPPILESTPNRQLPADGATERHGNGNVKRVRRA